MDLYHEIQVVGEHCSRVEVVARAMVDLLEKKM